MARFTGGGSGGSGVPGPRGPEGDSAYDVAVDNGFVGTEQEWLDSLVGSGSSADIADFVFDVFEPVGETTESRITVANHDMVIRTTRDDEQDSDIEIVSADDARVTAEDIIALRAGSYVAIRTGWDSTTEESDHRWEFSTEGQLLLPQGGVVSSNNGDLILDAEYNVYLRNSDTEDNRVATLGDIDTSIANYEPVEAAFVVNGGTLGTQPTFTGSPLFYGEYVKVGNIVNFDIQVDFDNITSFGTGQYYVTLPFNAKKPTTFRGGCLHDDSNGRQYAISGHVNAGSNELMLFSTDRAGNSVIDITFEHNNPITLTTAENFHIAGTYIADTEAP
jgi:hypothetical protein